MSPQRDYRIANCFPDNFGVGQKYYVDTVADDVLETAALFFCYGAHHKRGGVFP